MTALQDMMVSWSLSMLACEHHEDPYPIPVNYNLSCLWLIPAWKLECIRMLMSQQQSVGLRIEQTATIALGLKDRSPTWGKVGLHSDGWAGHAIERVLSLYTLPEFALRFLDQGSSAPGFDR
jgi:hypothetical protein